MAEINEIVTECVQNGMAWLSISNHSKYMEKLLKGVYTKCFVLEDSFKVSHLSLGSDTPRITFKSHSHDFYQIVWIRKGNGQHSVNFQTREIADNSLFFIAPNAIHSAELFGENDIVYISFKEDFFVYLCPMMETFIRYNVFGIASSFFLLSVTDEQADKLNSFVDAMQEEQECDKYLSSKMLRMGSLLTLFIIEIKRRLMDAKLDKMPSFGYRKVQDFIRALEKNMHKTHRAQDYAEMLGISYVSLYRYVTTILGVKPLDVIHNELVTHAKRMLASSSLSIKEIAENLGFDDEAKFVKMFVDITGVQPIQFRKHSMGDF